MLELVGLPSEEEEDEAEQGTEASLKPEGESGLWPEGNSK